MANKVKFGLSHVYYAILTSDAEGTAVYDTPVAVPGAVSLTLDAEGEQADFYADNLNYFSQSANAGYSGTLEIARLPDAFRKDVLDEVEDVAAGTLTENVGAHPKPFALMWEFDGDVNAVRHVLYNCSVTRPTLSGSTITKTKEPAPESLSIKATGISSGNVHAMTTKTDGTAYEGWYTTVWQPAGK